MTMIEIPPPRLEHPILLEHPRLEIYMPEKARDVLKVPSRYKVLQGGRGSGKSYAYANAAIARTLHHPTRFLCARETQNSIRDSVHRLLQDRIYALGLQKFFSIKNESITSTCGSEFFFKGLHHNISEIKSMEGIDVCWVEEAEKVGYSSWDNLIPTVRKDNSEIWISFNPEEEKSATYQRFIKNPPPDCLTAHLTHRDNKYFPEVLRKEMEYHRRVDFEMYEWVWEGKLKKYAADVIFKDKISVEYFETPVESRFFFGADWGFSADPTCLIRMFIQDNKLFIDWEFYGHGIEINELEQAFDTVPGSRKWRICGDSSRPDTISFMVQKGFNIIGAEKGKDSIEDGIQFLRSFEKIIIHTRCKGTIDDFSNYRFKKDKITDEVLPIPVDFSNHACDSVRYALETWRKSKVSIFDIDYAAIGIK